VYYYATLPERIEKLVWVIVAIVVLYFFVRKKQP